MAAPWYHHDISRVQAEDLLAKAGKDGSFLVRDSESVPGAYALCLLFQRHVHTYRILPDEEGLLAVQTIQGIPVKFFRTLSDLVAVYQQPNKGIVIPLLYPVERATELAQEDSDGEDGKAGVHCLSPATLMAAGNQTSTWSSPAHLKEAHIVQRMQLQLEDHIHSSPGNEFLELMADYVKNFLQQDLAALWSGHPNLRHLSRALGAACRGLHSEIDCTLSGLETLGKVFDHPTSPPSSAPKQAFSGLDPELEQLICKISTLSSLLSSLEKKVLTALQETVLNVALTNAPGTGSPVHSPNTPSSDGHKFEVRLGKTQKATVMVELEKGQVVIFKKGMGAPEETITHEQILQLVKFQSEPCKVKLVYGREQQRSLTRDIFFQNAKKREAFCQLLQLMKITHSALDEPDLISLYIGTWNMGGSPPPRSVATWLTSRGLGWGKDESTAALPHDVYVIGTQENSLGDREWVDFLRCALKTTVGIDYKAVAVQSLWSIKMAVLVRPEHERRISHITASSVKTGIANTLGNKGAVGVSFLFNGTSFGFVNCHLASGCEKTSRRNQNYLDILRSLAIGDRKLGVFDISLRFNHLFWFGDLNYRLDMEVQDVLNHVNKKEFDILRAMDQLNLEREKNKVFLRFSEEEISFPPTYRYERGARDSYNCHKFKGSGLRITAPSWCDRVLWKSHPETHITCTSYGCTDDIVTSDHSPVFATFEVGVTSQFLSRKDPSSSTETPACIEFESIEAIVKTSSRNKFFIEIHSYCLEEYQKSGENSSQSSEVTGFLKLGWSGKQLPLLHPIVADMEYLLDQHLLLTVKSCDGHESYGECCIAMRSMISSVPQQFETFLSHRGEETGSIRGWMKVQIPRDRRGTRGRLYDWISLEKDDAETQPLRSPNGVSSPTPRVMSRPCSFPNSSRGYTNPAYFIFEGIHIPKATSAGHGETPCSPCLKSPKEASPQPAPCKRQPSRSICQGSVVTQGQERQTRASTEDPLPRSPHGCLPWGISSQAQPTRRHKPIRQKRPKSAHILSSALPSGYAEDPITNPQTWKRPELSPKEQPSQSPSLGSDDDRSLTALQMAKCLSELDSQMRSGHVSASEQQYGASKNPLRHTRSSIADAWCSRMEGRRYQHEVQRHTRSRQLSGGCVTTTPSTARQWLAQFGLEQYEEAFCRKGWHNLETFRDIGDQDLMGAGVLNPTHRKLILVNLKETWQ
ncbi:phosphatidylinositol 3,4,5-trisphosphate 5-phosphatase 2-like isoform X2 [Pleurodeles waltl]|uniref:phosphatidylinositol 3,4,5-trisphosphate 5-phosphatase 2-like isoform X2 n=1 Tax=Pleurodeles waltl TaxID=8319 RepID=UPI00370985EF